MGDYATKGQGTAGVTLGTIGTVGAGLLLLNALNGNCGCGGGLGGLLGGNHNCCQQNQIQQLMAENAQLKSENYADKVGKEVYNQSIRGKVDMITRTVVPITAVCPQPQVANTQPAAAA